MIIRCDNCSVSLQLDEAKIPGGNFSVRCPRCQNLLRVQKDSSGKGLSTVEQLAASQPAAPTADGANDFAVRETEAQINNAMRSLLTALQHDKGSVVEEEEAKLRRILLCLGPKYQENTAKVMAGAGYKVYVAQ